MTRALSIRSYPPYFVTFAVTWEGEDKILTLSKNQSITTKTQLLGFRKVLQKLYLENTEEEFLKHISLFNEVPLERTALHRIRNFIHYFTVSFCEEGLILHKKQPQVQDLEAQLMGSGVTELQKSEELLLLMLEEDNVNEEEETTVT